MNNIKFLVIKWFSAIAMFGLYYLLILSILYVEKSMILLPIGPAGRHLYCLTYCMVFVIILYFLEAFRIGERRILDLIFGFFMSSLVINFVMTILSLIFTTLQIRQLFGLFVFEILAESIIGFCWIMFCHRIYERYQFCREAIFIYGSRENESEYTRINNTINKFFRINRSLHYEIGLDSIFQEIQSSAVVFLGDIPVDIRNPLIKFCMSKKIECYSIPKISDIYIQNARVMQLHDKLLLRYPQLGITGGKWFAKRVTDIVISSLMIAVFSPIMLAITIAIKLDDGGPVFYYQDRVTQDGKPFKMQKFRSMRTDAEKDGMTMTTKDDDRVTKVGRIIRNIHFDELPQLLNILRGDMSLVGPRPERREFIEEYSQKIPEFSERLKVKGGLTGYAQIYGRYNSEPEDKIKYDLYYIYHYSYWLDIKILILTIRILFQKENTEGFEKERMEAMKRKKRGK